MFAVSCCFPLLSHAVLRCYCGDTVIKEPRFLRPRAGSPLYFFGIISEISERRRRQRPEFVVRSCLFAAFGLQEFQSLAPDLFLLCVRGTTL
jgi:hypothetical protein